MSDKIFVHYPACTAPRIENEFDKLIRRIPSLSVFRDRVEIYSTPHAVKLVAQLEALPKKRDSGNYALYVLLFVLTRWSLPPRSVFRKNLHFAKDRCRLRYHAKAIDSCAAGIFVPREDGMWPYNMWQNARRCSRQGKPIWQIIGSKEAGWKIVKLESPPARKLRLSRKETLAGIGLYAEPHVYPNLYTLIRDAFKSNSE